MARIVINCWGSFGDINPYLGLGAELARRGHEPILAAPGFYAEVAASEGLGFRAVGPGLDPTDATLLARLMDPRIGSRVILAEILTPAIRETWRELTVAIRGADLLVSHPVTFAAPIVAEQTGMPWVSTVLSPMSFFSRFEAPVVSPAPWLKSLERWVPPLGGAVARLARVATRRWIEPVDRLRKALGLRRGENPIFEGQHASALVLALFSRLLAEPQPDWPPQTLITGQITHDASHGTGLTGETKTFLADGPAPVVFTLGSSAVRTAGTFYEHSIAAARQTGRRAILLAGDGAAALRPRLGRDMLALDAAPHSQLLPEAAAVVHHCGVGTLGHALRAGRPMLAVPFAHDQPDNAHRVERLGVARIVRPRAYAGARVARELDALLGDPSYAHAAARVGDRARAENGAVAACDAIESLLRRTRAGALREIET